MLKQVRHFGIGCMVWDRLGHSVEDRDGRTESDGRSQARPLFVRESSESDPEPLHRGEFGGPAKAVG